jgi:hypothetical protein
MTPLNTASVGIKMTFYWWTHWFWITALLAHVNLSSPVPFSSLETISTSLKSALVQNDNSFQQTGDQQKIVPGSKSVAPLTFETSDSDDLFGIASEMDAENIAKNSDWLSKPSETNDSNINRSESTEKPKVKLEQNLSTMPVGVIVGVSNDPSYSNNNNNNVNSTNSSQLTTTATTMLTSIAESNNR